MGKTERTKRFTLAGHRRNLAYVSLCVVRHSEVERCQQNSYVLNAMASGQFHAPPVVALVAGTSPGSWSGSASSATEVANVGVTFAAVRQKLNPTHSNDGPLSSTPPDETASQNVK